RGQRLRDRPEGPGPGAARPDGRGTGRGCRAGGPRGREAVAGGRVPATDRRRRGDGMTPTGLALRQVPYETKSFWRNPAAAYFTFASPIVFLVIFNLLFGTARRTLPGGHTIKQSTFYVAAIVAFSVITASFTNPAVNVVF